MADVVYNSFFSGLFDAKFDLNTNQTKVMLVQSGYVPAATHIYRSSVTNECPASGGYSTGGEIINNPVIIQDNAVGVARFKGNNVIWLASTITARGAIVYKVVGSAATDLLMFYYDFNADKSSDNTDFKIIWSPDGILVAKKGY